jgi:hypothetical protein
VIGASGLSDGDNGKNDGLKWKLAESVRQRNNIFTASPLSSFSNSRVDRRIESIQIIDLDEGGPKLPALKNVHTCIITTLKGQ